MLNAPDSRLIAESSRSNTGSILLIVPNIPRKLLEILDEKLETLLSSPPNRWSIPPANEVTASLVLLKIPFMARCREQLVLLTLENELCTVDRVIPVLMVYDPNALRNPVEPIVPLVPRNLPEKSRTLPRLLVKVEHKLEVTFTSVPMEPPKHLVRLTICRTDPLTLLDVCVPLI